MLNNSNARAQGPTGTGIELYHHVNANVFALALPSLGSEDEQEDIVANQKFSNSPLKSDYPSVIFRRMAELHHTSTHAARFYGSRLSPSLDYPLRKCFQNLKNLHGNLKNILSAELRAHTQHHASGRDKSSLETDSRATEIALRYRSLSLLVPKPGPDLIDYLVTTERRQKRLHRELLEELGDASLKISISAQTAMLQVTIDRMAAFAAHN